MKPIVSESGHTQLTAAGVLQQADVALQRACYDMAPLELRGLTFSWRMMHFGRGYYTPGDGASPHIHEQLHLESILSGVFRFEHDAHSLDLLAGQSLLVFPHKRHHWTCTSEGVMIGALIDVTGPAKEEFFDAARRPSNGMIIVRPESFGTWHRELLRLLTSPTQLTWQAAAITSVLRLLMIDLLNEMADLTPWKPREGGGAGEARAHDLCKHAQEFIEANYGQPIQIADVAMQVGVSERHLTRLYRQVHDESIGASLQKLRLERARRYVREHPDEMIKTVAYKCGFNSPAYFTASYRKAYGRTPAEDRYPGI